MKITIESIPQARMRDPRSVGDYYRTADGHLYIFVSDLADERHTLLVALHEMVEEAVTRHRGIAEPDILAFDLAHPELDDPGMDPRAPYHREHLLATGVEMIVAGELEVDWTAYGEACAQVVEGKPETVKMIWLDEAYRKL